jgi:altronate dehydratase
VAAARRTAQPLKHLRIALQCGGSDAFSGVSGNPLAGWCARHAVRHGGAAVLAETDELIGAEAYVTDGARHAGVATRFVETVERFKLWMRWHGQSAEANPSGGNNFRGIYNISLKSLGAAKKKPADVRLDDVLEYGECISARCAANAAAAERGLPAGAGAAEEAGADGMPSGFGGRGYFFMDSPGNDLESIAGQVATGCNVITFTTGNGAMTNFPFVPTLKLITTSGRYELLPGEMDFNCGRFQDGEDMGALGAELFALMVRTCSGEQPSKGERAGHSQVSIWREWTQTGFAEDGEGGGGGGAEAREAAAKMAAAAAGASNGVGGKGDDQTVDGDRMRAQAASLLARLHHPVVAALEKAGGVPVALHAATTAAAAADAGASDRAGSSHVVQALQFATGLAAGREPALDAVGLVLPTSLCSSQIAVLIAERMNAAIAAAAAAGADGSAAPFGSILRFVALPHTEGCGCGTIGEDASLYEDVLLGHLTHPSVASALLLEHGCEMKHNDLWHQQLAKAGMSAEQYGWASVQIDGGIDAAYAKAQAWFVAHPARAAPVSGGLGALRLALMAAERLPAAVGALFAAVARVVVEAGGTVVVPSNSALLRNTAFLDELLECKDVVPTLAFGGRVGSASASRREPPRPGLHVMSSTTLHWVEQLCGLGAARCNIALAYAPTPKQGHPMMPVVQVAAARPRAGGGAPPAKKLRCAANPSADIVLCDFSECCLAASVAPDPTQATVGACGWLDDTLRVLAAVGSRERVTTNANDTDFQVTRGTTGCSN